MFSVSPVKCHLDHLGNNCENPFCELLEESVHQATNPELLSQSLTPEFLRNQSQSQMDHPSHWEPYRYSMED